MYKIGDRVEYVIFQNVAMADGTFEPRFFVHDGPILRIEKDLYVIWGPGGEQTTKVGIECIRRKMGK